MVEDKPSTPLLPQAMRGLSQAVQQPRRHITNKLVLAVIAVAVIYCLAISSSSWSAPRQQIQNVFLGAAKHLTDSAQGAAIRLSGPVPPSRYPSSTTSRPFSAATTLKAQTGPHQLHFRQPPKSVVVVRRGGDVQLDCTLETKPHAIVTWYKDKDVFLTMGKRTYVDDERIDAFVDEESLNWGLRIRSVMMSDAGTYSCHLALASQDIITVELDVIPNDDAITPMPARLPAKVVDLFVPGFLTLPGPDVCPNEGSDIDTVIAVASHPLYVTSRDRVRESWAAVTNKKHQALVFGVGDINAAISETVHAEAKKYNDILVGKFHDISIEPYVEGFKRLSLLQWVAEHCRWAKSVLLVTHNQFVNPLLLKQVVDELNPDEPAIYGLTDGNRTVQRDPNSPLYLSYTSYQRQTLPEYVQKPAILVSRAAVYPLYEAALQTHDVPHYDIMLTALAAPAANITRKHMPNIYKEAMRIEGCDYESFIAGGSWGVALDKKVAKLIASGNKCEVKG